MPNFKVISVPLVGTQPFVSNNFCTMSKDDILNSLLDTRGYSEKPVWRYLGTHTEPRHRLGLPNEMPMFQPVNTLAQIIEIKHTNNGMELFDSHPEKYAAFRLKHLRYTNDHAIAPDITTAVLCGSRLKRLKKQISGRRKTVLERFGVSHTRE